MKPVPRMTLTERVAGAVLDQILEEGLTEGDPLASTGELAKRLDVSVIVVREALATLAGRGIISRRQGRESVVSRPGVEVLDSIFRVRMRQDSITQAEFEQCRTSLELESAALASAAGSSEDRAAALLPLVETMRHETDIDGFTSVDQQFHLQIAELSGNRALSLLLSSVSSLVHESIRSNVVYVLQKQNAEDLAFMLDNHTAIADAIINGDRRRAIAEMSKHFTYWGPQSGLAELLI